MAAAAVAASNNSRHSSAPIAARDEEEEPSLVMASYKQHTFEQVSFMKQTNDGRWLERIIALTVDTLYIGKKTKDGFVKTIDHIPLDEITALQRAMDETKPVASPEDHKDSVMASINPRKQNQSRNSRTLSRDSIEAQSPFRTDSGSIANICRIVTREDGFNSGKVYVFQAPSDDVCKRWIKAAEETVHAAIEKSRALSRFQEFQLVMRNIYNHMVFQGVVFCCIMINFVLHVARAQFNPNEGSHSDKAFETADLCLTVFFTVELIINLFGHWWIPFMNDGWSLFDLLVVCVSWISVAFQNSGLSVLRIVRAFRAIRLIGRLKELRRIVAALAASVLPVLNALVICAIINSIFAIAAVTFFSERSDKKFGTFARASYTMFLMATGFEHPFKGDMELYDEQNNSWDLKSAFFFGMFIVVSVWTLLQVMVAVLLDNFIAASQADRNAEQELRMKDYKLQPGALDPLMEDIVRRFHTRPDLKAKINQLFERFDIDQGGSLSFEEMRDGLKKLHPGGKDLTFTRDDYETLKHELDHREQAEDEITQEEFFEIMWKQLRSFVQKNLCNSTLVCGDEFQRSGLQSMKWMLATDEHFEDMEAGSAGKFGTGDPVRLIQQLSNDMNYRMDRLERNMSSLLNWQTKQEDPANPFMPVSNSNGNAHGIIGVGLSPEREANGGLKGSLNPGTHSSAPPMNGVRINGEPVQGQPDDSLQKATTPILQQPPSGIRNKYRQLADKGESDPRVLGEVVFEKLVEGLNNTEGNSRTPQKRREAPNPLKEFFVDSPAQDPFELSPRGPAQKPPRPSLGNTPRGGLAVEHQVTGLRE